MAEIYGTDVFEDAKDKLKALMVLLITDMALDDPAIAAAYDYPNIVAPTFNAVSIHIGSAESLDDATYSVSANGPDVLYELTFIVRVHIAHGNGSFDSDKVSRLMNSVSNKLHKNLDLGDNFRIKYTSDYSFNETFEESDTIGGEFNVVLHKFASHAQE